MTIFVYLNNLKLMIFLSLYIEYLNDEAITTHSNFLRLTWSVQEGLELITSQMLSDSTTTDFVLFWLIIFNLKVCGLCFNHLW
jgi:hypothetical protein